MDTPVGCGRQFPYETVGVLEPVRKKRSAFWLGTGLLSGHPFVEDGSSSDRLEEWADMFHTLAAESVPSRPPSLLAIIAGPRQSWEVLSLAHGSRSMVPAEPRLEGQLADARTPTKAGHCGSGSARRTTPQNRPKNSLSVDIACDSPAR